MNSARLSTVRLLVRPTPDFREGAREYVQRVAKVNGFRGADEIARFFGVRLGHIVTQGTDKLLNVIQGKANPDILRLRSGDLPLTRSGEGTLDTSLSARVCPRCLGISDVLSATWSLPLSISCRKHKTVLLDRCPRCFTWVRYSKSLYRCRCGLDFRQTCTRPAPPWERHYYELFAPWRIVPARSVSTTDLLRIETLAGRMTRRLIRQYRSEEPSDTKSLADPPHWWINSTDHPALDALCQDDASLGEITLRVFPGFPITSNKLYASQTTELGITQPGVLRLAHELARARGLVQPRNQQQVREARRARLSMHNSVALSLGVSPSALANLLRIPSWQKTVRAISGEAEDRDLLQCVQSCVGNTMSVEGFARTLGVSAESLSDLRNWRSPHIVRLHPRLFAQWRIPKALAEELTQAVSSTKSNRVLALRHAIRMVAP